MTGNESGVTREGVERPRPGREAPADDRTVRRRQGRGGRRGGRRGRGEQEMVPEAEFRSYYGQPILNGPVWSSTDIAGYLFLGGLAGASSAVGAAADVRGEEGLARVSKTGAAAASVLSLGALVHDLGRPSRFLNMLRVVKVTSPMNVGAWLLSAYAPATIASAGSALTGRLRPLGVAGTAGAAALGPAVAAYTGTLVSDTAVPAWHDGYREMPFVFVGSGAMAAGGLGLLAAPPEERDLPRRVALLGALTEVGVLKTMERRLGFIAEPYRKGRAGRLMKIGEGLAAAGSASALLGRRGGRRGRTADAAAGAMLLAGSACTRFGIFSAGVASADDPRYTVQPQRERLRARAAQATPPAPEPDPPARPEPAEQGGRDGSREPVGSASIEFWQQQDRLWRWRWKSPDGSTVLVSHRAYDSMAQAAESAQSSFPETAPAPAAAEEEVKHPGIAAATVAGAVVAGAVRRWLRR